MTVALSKRAILGNLLTNNLNKFQTCADSVDIKMCFHAEAYF